MGPLWLDFAIMSSGLISVVVQDQFGDPDPTVGAMPESSSQTSLAQLVELFQAERSAAEDREKRLKVRIDLLTQQVQSLTLMITNATLHSVELTSTSSAAIASAGEKKRRKHKSAQQSGSNNRKDRTASSTLASVETPLGSIGDFQTDSNSDTHDTQHGQVPAGDANYALSRLQKFEDLSEDSDCNTSQVGLGM